MRSEVGNRIRTGRAACARRWRDLFSLLASLTSVSRRSNNLTVLALLLGKSSASVTSGRGKPRMTDRKFKPPTRTILPESRDHKYNIRHDQTRSRNTFPSAALNLLNIAATIAPKHRPISSRHKAGPDVPDERIHIEKNSPYQFTL